MSFCESFQIVKFQVIADSSHICPLTKRKKIVTTKSDSSGIRFVYLFVVWCFLKLTLVFFESGQKVAWVDLALMEHTHIFADVGTFEARMKL